MPEIILPDSRMDTMEGYYPNRKPVGNVKIDWDHPLAMGLVFARVSSTNLAGNRSYTASDYIDHISGSSGVGSDFSSATIGDTYAEIDFSGFNEASSFCISEYYGGGEWSSSASRQDGSFIPIRLGNYGHPQSVVWTGETVTAVMSDNVITGEVFSSGSSWSNSNTLDLYVNGTLDAAEPTPTGSITATSNPFVVGTTETGVEAYSGTIYFICLYNRRLSPGEQLSLHENPYQFLIPAG